MSAPPDQMRRQEVVAPPERLLWRDITNAVGAHTPTGLVVSFWLLADWRLRRRERSGGWFVVREDLR